MIEYWRPQPDSLHFVQGKFISVVPLEKRDVLEMVKREVGRLWRPQPDLNRCCRRERPMSWTWLDDGDTIRFVEW